MLHPTPPPPAEARLSHPLSRSATAPPTTSLPGAPEAFAPLMDGFRRRLDREIAAFLAAKRAAATPSATAMPSAATDRPGAANPAAPAGAVSAALSDPADLVEGVARLIAEGGKRLRPALIYYTYRACGGRADEQALPLALATELLHTYLLIHDDIMDHAAVRRGHPAAHVRFADLHRASGLRGDAADFGRSVAILLGDLAHTYAVELFAATATAAATTAAAAAAATAAAGLRDPGEASATPHPWAELHRCFSAMCEEVIGGQYMEFLLAHRALPGGAPAAAAPAPAPALAPPPAPGPAVREAELLRVLRLKSGRYTAERPIQLGALLAGAPPAVRAELSRYGTAVGEAFQLQDDLLGLFGDPALTGKPVGDDLREGKFTFLIHHALAAGDPADRRQLTAALGKADLAAGEVAQVQRIVERTGARRAVEAMIATRLGEARRALDALAPRLAGEGLLFLSGLLDYLWEREL
jgi:geranylgeranyl diphosphate synthase, type I